jgi:membrane protease YdiL (CAAX protease family)
MNTQNTFASIKNKTLLIVVTFIYLLPILIFGILVPLITDNETIKYALTIFSAIIWGILAFWAMRRDSINLGVIGFQRAKIYQAALILLIGWILFAIGFIFIVLIAKDDNLTFSLGNPMSILQQWLFVGICEELLFRGYLLTRLKNKFTRIPTTWGILLALFITNIIFATMHIPVKMYQLFQMTGQYTIAPVFLSVVNIFIIGLIFSYLFLRTRNILMVGLIHGGVNAPIVGQGGEVIFVIIIIIIVELWIFIQGRLKKKYSLQDTT